MWQSLVPFVYKRQNTLLYLSLVINWEFVEKLWLQIWFCIDLGMEIEVFWDITLCGLVNGCRWMASYPRIPEFSVALLSKCQILYSQSIFKARMYMHKVSDYRLKLLSLAFWLLGRASFRALYRRDFVYWCAWKRICCESI